MMFRSVLAAAEFRSQPDPAVLNGARVANLTDARLHVLHCATLDGGSRVNSQAILELLPPGSELSIMDGEPHELITARALTIGADVIVLGPCVRSSPISGLLGTTAEKVLRASRVPCLVSNASLVERPRRILLAMDRSVPAREALRVCTALARELASRGVDISVHLLNVSAFARPRTRGVPRWVDLKKYAEKLLAGVETAAVSHSVLSAALPAEGILDWVRSNGPDVVVMGTHGSSFIGRLLLGSVARGVALAAHVPILLVPPRARDFARTTS
jgi:nucleotide-binding universal stress UspA family protein